MNPLRATAILVAVASLGLAAVTPSTAADPSALVSGAAGGGQAVKVAGDQGRIAFVQKDNVYVMAADGRHVRQLTDTGDQKSSPVWSPDGRWIAFIGGGVWVVAADGGRSWRLANTGAKEVRDVAGVAWSPDGRRIAYATREWEPESTCLFWQMFVANRDGSEVHPLFKGPADCDYNVPPNGAGPAWSPDGRWIAFDPDVRWSAHHYLSVMHPDGTKVKRLARTVPAVGELGPAWSPDGRQVAWSDASKQGGVKVVDRRNGKVRRLSRGNDVGVAWSPSGRRIAFVRSAGYDEAKRLPRYDVYVMRADGSKERRLQRGWYVQWSPDGRRLLFWQPGSSHRADGWLKVMDADGRHVRTLRRGNYGYGAVPWFGAAPTRTSVNAQPQTVPKGARVRLTGAVTKVGVRLPGATVKIMFKASGAPRFTARTQATTNAKGRFGVTTRARTTGMWKAVHPATAATRASSATDRVTVRRR